MNPMSRRLLLAGAGLVAAAAGAALGWRRLQRPMASPESDAFWQTTLTGPDGQPVHLAGMRGKPLLVNFWATWCPPCVKELPDINRFYGEVRGRGWQVLGIAVDNAEPVQAFLTKMPLDFPIAVTGAAGASLARSLGNLEGGLPFSVVFDEAGQVSWRRLGTTRLDELRALAAS
jgi:peroxiredoxin